jgi:hypothetical protein
MNPEVNKEIQDLKNQIKDLKRINFEIKFDINQILALYDRDYIKSDIEIIERIKKIRNL